ncbi:MAG: hypothetical protein L0287_31340, partial [Anaerolineae bacterium]|nr:hypothetical protein [Anaerolineae bacterium]
WVKVTFSQPAGYDALEIGAMFLGWSLQWTLNHKLGWTQGPNDITTIIRSSSGIPLHNSKQIRDTLSMLFDWSGRNDTTYARYFITEFSGWKSVFISVEPEANTVYYERDGKRSQRLTYYGKGTITGLTETTAPGRFRYGFNFQEDFGGAGRPPYVVAQQETVVYPAAQMHTSTQAITTGATGEQITFTSEYDPFNWANGTEIIPDGELLPARITAAIILEDQASEYDVEAIIEVNGIEIDRQSGTAVNNATISQYGVSFLFGTSADIHAGDVITLRIKHNFGSDVSVNGGNLSVAKEVVF